MAHRLTAGVISCRAACMLGLLLNLADWLIALMDDQLMLLDLICGPMCIYHTET